MERKTAQQAISLSTVELKTPVVHPSHLQYKSEGPSDSRQSRVYNVTEIFARCID